jgi:hypothetical protein
MKVWNRWLFTHEVTIHVSDRVNAGSVISGIENPVTYILERSILMVNVWCRVTCDKLYSPVFFAEDTVCWGAYLDMLELVLVPQLLLESMNMAIFKQDGVPLHCVIEVCDFLNDAFNDDWCDCSGPIV